MINSKKKNKLALIGIGYWGKIYAKYLEKSEKFNLTYIYFRKNNPINFIKNKFSKILTNDLEKIIKDNNVQFINIVTPIKSHSNLVEKFLHKKKILVEKPLLMSLPQRKKFEKNKKKITVSYPYLYSPSLNMAKNIIKKNKIGKIKYIEIIFHQLGRFSKDSVNKLLAPHTISILSMFLNINNVIFKVNSLIKKKNKIETSFIECFKKKRNVANMMLSLNYAGLNKKKEVNIYCNNGFIRCDLNNKNSVLEVYKIKRTKMKKKFFENVNSQLIIQKKYDEANNIASVIKDFTTKNFNNFKLTKRIDTFLKNEK